MTAEERRTDPVEPTLPWKDVEDANVDPAFLYPVEDPPCLVAHARKMTKQEQQQYLQWISEVLRQEEVQGRKSVLFLL